MLTVNSGYVEWASVMDRETSDLTASESERTDAVFCVNEHERGEPVEGKSVEEITT